MAFPEHVSLRRLPVLGDLNSHKFVRPIKRIHEGHDVPNFLTSQAYRDIMTFILQLNISMCPRTVISNDTGTVANIWQLDSEDMACSSSVEALKNLLQDVDAIRHEAPPYTGPRRFGNVSFRNWYSILEARIPALLSEHLPAHILQAGIGGEAMARDEITSYFMGSFGSSQRLDYGTGHELAFMAFLGCLWKLGAFGLIGAEGTTERSIVLGVIEPYVHLFFSDSRN